jgi:hypothetical protein
MPLSKLFWYYFWIAPHVLQVGIAGVMLRRRLVQGFPWFFAYTCFQVLEFGLLFTLFRLHITGELYFRCYSVMSIVDTILRFGIILEVLRQLASSYVVLARVLKPFFRWSAICLLIAALASALYVGGQRPNHTWFVANLLDRTALIVQTGLLAGILLFSRYLTLSWRNLVLGIALGLGLYAVVDLGTSVISSRDGFWHAELLDWANMGAYHLSVLLWLFYVLVPQGAPMQGAQEVSAHDELEVWNDELERLLHQR